MTDGTSFWQRWVPRVGALSAAVTTLCCLGVTAAVSLMSAIGATFMTMDDTLRPLLAATLLVTVGGSALTYRSHRNPAPLIITVLSAITVFLAIFGSGLFAHAGEAHGGADTMHGGGHSGGNVLAWFGLTVLILAQFWDFWLVRGHRRRLRAA